jgi:serine/threonine protein phosphatase PrpC
MIGQFSEGGQTAQCGAMRLYGHTIGMTESVAFQGLPPDVQEDLRQRHPHNDDACYVGPAGMFVADGVSTTSLGGEASNTVIRVFTNFLLRRVIFTERPEMVMEIAAYAAAEADAALAQTCEGKGGSTLTGFMPTNDPRQWVGFHTADSRGVQERGGQVLYRTTDQVVLNEESGMVSLANSFSGAGRGALRIANGKILDDPDLVRDRITIIEARPGDRFAAHTDGLAVRRANMPAVTLPPEIIARTVDAHPDPRTANNALMQLPYDISTASYSLDPAEYCWPKIDDRAAATGFLMLGRLY